ncbi:MAG: GNAT family N-acetyltransferase [Akkermansia sp.]
MSSLVTECLRDMDNPRVRRALEVYRRSFPYSEQREPAAQERMMRDEAYRFGLLRAPGRDVGALLWWEHADFLYLEHFFVYPEERNRGWGAAALRCLQALGRPIVLEIEPPQDDISRRRRAFYERCGFCTTEHAHLQPPYHAGQAELPLVVMSYPRAVDAAEYAAFNRFLRGYVMRASRA